MNKDFISKIEYNKKTAYKLIKIIEKQNITEKYNYCVEIPIYEHNTKYIYNNYLYLFKKNSSLSSYNKKVIKVTIIEDVYKNTIKISILNKNDIDLMNIRQYKCEDNYDKYKQELIELLSIYN